MGTSANRGDGMCDKTGKRRQLDPHAERHSRGKARWNDYQNIPHLSTRIHTRNKPLSLNKNTEEILGLWDHLELLGDFPLVERGRSGKSPRGLFTDLSVHAGAKEGEKGGCTTFGHTEPLQKKVPGAIQVLR